MSDEVTAKVEKFFSGQPMRKYSKGQVLILNGEIPNQIFYLIKGLVKQYDINYRGDEVIVNIFKPLAFFPMTLAINKADNRFIYEAETNIELRAAPSDEVIKFIKQNPDVMYDLLGRLYRGMDGVLGRMVFLMSSSAQGRLIYELVVEARRFGDKQADETIKLQLNEKDLAARTGLSRETVSRAMVSLKSDNLIQIHGKTIVVKELNELEQKLAKIA